MKSIYRWICGLVSFGILLVWLAPLLAGVADLGGWFFGVGSVSGVDWTDSRVAFAMIWTLLTPWALIPIAAALAPE